MARKQQDRSQKEYIKRYGWDENNIIAKIIAGDRPRRRKKGEQQVRDEVSIPLKPYRS